MRILLSRCKQTSKIQLICSRLLEILNFRSCDMFITRGHDSLRPPPCNVSPAALVLMMKSDTIPNLATAFCVAGAK